MGVKPDLLTSPIGSTILRLATPNIISMFVLQAALVAEAWYIGHLGTVQLAGLALVFPMFMLIMMLSAGSMGGAITGAIAQQLGKGARIKAEELAVNALVLSALLAAISCFIFLSGGKRIYSILGGSGFVLKQALLYSDLFFIGCFSMWFSNALAAIVRATGNMTVAAVGVTIGFLVQGISSAVFVFGFGPIPSMGIAGAAAGAVLGFSVAAILHFYFLIFICKQLTLRLSAISGSFEPMVSIVRVAALSSINVFCSVASVITIGAFMAGYGVDILAGYGIGARLEFLLIPMIFGFGAASTVMVGTHFGAGLIDRAHIAGWTASFFAAIISGLIGGLVAIFPQLWANVFTEVEAVRAACIAYLRIAGPFYAFFALGLCLYFASQGAGRVFWPVMAVVLRFAIVLIGTLFLSRMGSASIELYFILIASGMIAQGLFSGLSVHLGAWIPRRS
ncbi:MAG: MATE family efflux transporter [Pseudomonadota bacterium]|nr:MATE family efflux transporter [Pseudomonadota bacterium]